MRIVSLSPSLTEILFRLNADGDLVGITDACETRGKDVARVGSPKAIQLSRIDALSPDWVLTDSQDNRPEDIRPIERKWRTKLFDVKSPVAVLDAIAELGRLLEKKEEAKHLNEALQDEISSSGEAFRGREKKRTVLLLWEPPYLTVNFDTYPSRLVEASGGVNVFHEEPLREFPVEVEEMIEKDPEVLLLSGEPAPFRPRHIARFRQYRIFSRIPIHLVEGKCFTQYGAQTIVALKRLREIYEALS